MGGLGDGLRDLGHTADQLSVASATEAEREALQLEEPITEYCRLVRIHELHTYIVRMYICIVYIYCVYIYIHGP